MIRSRRGASYWWREGDRRIEAFGIGEPWPALAWLLGHGRASRSKRPTSGCSSASQTLGGDLERVEVETWSADAVATPSDVLDDLQVLNTRAHPKVAPKVAVRRLNADDRAAFSAAAPAWALRGWQSYASLIEHGAAFGVPHGNAFAAMAWVFDQTDGFDAVGVATAPRFRRLGLGRAVAATLVTHILERRGKVPLWSFPEDHAASRGLAASLGFVLTATETVVYHPSRAEATPEP